MTDSSSVGIVDLAGIIANHLLSHGIHVVLVGGLAVEIYTENRYLTADIDFVDVDYTTPSKLKRVMAEIGFLKSGKDFINATTTILVEFPSPPLAVGGEQVSKVSSISTKHRNVTILQALDIVKDRLLAYLYWYDFQSAVQAIAISLAHSIDDRKLHDFFELEDERLKGQIVLETLDESSKLKEPSMENIEEILIRKRMATKSN